MSSTRYKYYDAVTPEILDTVKVGNQVRLNGWKMPLSVKGVSKNFFVMERNAFGKPLYSVVDKRHLFAGPDNCIFGHPLGIIHHDLYHFADKNVTREYLESFESGEVEISQRRGARIEIISIGEVLK